MSDVEKRIEQWRAGLVGSDLLERSDVIELESHLREEMEHMRAAGLSDEERFLIARHRLGDTAALVEEFAKMRPHRQLVQRLFWMTAGILGYYLAFYMSSCANSASAALGYAIGLRNPFLSVLACTVHVAIFAGIGALLWRFLDSSASRAVRRTPISLPVGLLAAGAIVALSFVASTSHFLLFRIMSSQGFTQVAMAGFWASTVWVILMPFLLVGLIALLTLRDRQNTQNA